MNSSYGALSAWPLSTRTASKISKTGKVIFPFCEIIEINLNIIQLKKVFFLKKKSISLHNRKAYNQSFAIGFAERQRSNGSSLEELIGESCTSDSRSECAKERTDKNE